MIYGIFNLKLHQMEVYKVFSSRMDAELYMVGAKNMKDLKIVKIDMNAYEHGEEE